MMFDYSRNVSLNTMLNGILVPYDFSRIVVALLLEEPEPSDMDGSLVEPFGNNYSRAQCFFWSNPVFSGPGAVVFNQTFQTGHGTVVNAVPVIFPQATGVWGTIISVAILSGELSAPSNAGGGGSSFGGNTGANAAAANDNAGQLTGTGGAVPLFYGSLRAPVNIDQTSAPLVFLPGQIRIEITGKCIGDITRDSIMTGYFTGGSNYPQTYYLALLSNLPESDGTDFNEVTEPGNNNYQRPNVELGTFTPPAGGICYNMESIDFNSPTGNWGSDPVVAWALMDEPSGGDMWWFGKWRIPLPPQTVDSPSIVILPGQLSVGFDIGAWG